MFYSEDYCTTSLSCENAEVFRKETLQSKVMDEKRGKQKRRDKVSKTKSQNASKSKHAKAGGDVLAQIKAKENIVAPNNSGQRITICREHAPALFTQRVGIYNKGKSSLNVSRRRPLHELQVSQKTAQETAKDLKRVLGYCEKSPLKRSPRIARGRNSPMMIGGQQHEEQKQSSEMEMTPSPKKQTTATSADSDILLCIAQRIAEGLHPRMVYSDTDYLNNVKSELRKLLKSGVGGGTCQPNMETAVADGKTGSSPTSYFPPPSAAAGTTMFDTFFSLPLFDQPGQSSQPDTGGFRLDMPGSTIFETMSAPSHTEPGPPFNLTEVELTTSNFDPSYPPPTPVLVEDASVNFQMDRPLSPSAVLDPPRDILDILDTAPHGAHSSSTSGGGHSWAPGSKWLPTPERPPMFPQKLY